MSDLRPAVLSAVLLFACLLPGFSTPAPAQPAASPAAATPTPTPAPTIVDIRGRVTQARRNGQGELPVGTLQVEGPLEPDTRYDKATVHVGHKSRVYVGRERKPASFSFIHSGDLVEVIFEGPPTAATESQPVKGTAATVVVLEHKP